MTAVAPTEISTVTSPFSVSGKTAIVTGAGSGEQRPLSMCQVVRSEEFLLLLTQLIITVQGSISPSRHFSSLEIATSSLLIWHYDQKLRL